MLRFMEDEFEWGCRTNVRQLILYLYTKDMSVWGNVCYIQNMWRLRRFYNHVICCTSCYEGFGVFFYGKIKWRNTLNNLKIFYKTFQSLRDKIKHGKEERRQHEKRNTDSSL